MRDGRFALQRGVLAVEPPAGHHVVALGEFVQQLRNVRGIVLQIAVEPDDDLTGREVDAGHHGGRLAEVAPKIDHLEARIPGGYDFEIGFGRIAAAIVDEDHFVISADILQRSAHAFVQGKDIVLLVIYGDDDGNHFRWSGKV